MERCVELLVGNLEKGGHFFTVHAPRQAGKTWLMMEAEKEIERKFPYRFITARMSCQGIVMDDDMPVDVFLNKVPTLMLDGFDMDIDAPETWEDWTLFFRKGKGLFEKPVILFIDEFDSLPPHVIDRVVGLFREIYLNRSNYLLHGLALVVVSAVVGAQSDRGSPFNIQRSLRVPNFSREEVDELFDQYGHESGQKVEPGVVGSVFESTRGQPGLVGWFGELLTEKYNPGEGRTIDAEVWGDTFRLALAKEWNNTVMNLLAKAKAEHLNRIAELFARSDIPFSIDSQWCRYAYLHGIIDSETATDVAGKKTEVCRFANPFIQLRLYNGLSREMYGDRTPILALEPLDDLADVFDKTTIDVPALLDRYADYLKRLKAKGIDPWKDQPRRADLRLSEAAGHFHLYAWLQNAVGRRCAIGPEFSTGNGRVDLHLKCGDKRAVIEVKSFTDLADLKNSKKQAAGYAKKLNLESVALAVFVPVDDDKVLSELSGRNVVDGIVVFVSAIGWT